MQLQRRTAYRYATPTKELTAVHARLILITGSRKVIQCAATKTDGIPAGMPQHSGTHPSAQPTDITASLIHASVVRNPLTPARERTRALHGLHVPMASAASTTAPLSSSNRQARAPPPAPSASLFCRLLRRRRRMRVLVAGCLTVAGRLHRTRFIILGL